ncbi:hypothetical protein WJ32_27860 [Burkholderia ubonensis]|uniref:Uncharacterized protein n=1 Tax=Burkholderia ubonensis TaxID=101571 RepID=A0A103RZB8_9BURK|nr:hypothetical protein [Burkholderia ubonensis]AOJ66211.1 hypothetical protein WJ32_27860 [Burkholderia ubonensis]KVG76509.1 hypothetical protein WJ33_12470 [Burkholderia ubonensis]
MPLPSIYLTAPMASTDSEIWFSAFGFGWGYAAYALTSDTLRQHLGAADASHRQLLLAFELNRQRILRAIALCPLPLAGERVTLLPSDL